MQPWRHIFEAFESFFILVWSVTFGALFKYQLGVGAEDISVVGILIEGYLMAFAIVVENKFQWLFTFTINLSEAWRKTVGSALWVERAQRTYADFENKVDELPTSLKEHCALAAHLLRRALDQEVRRTVPFVLNTVIFMLAVYCWLYQIYPDIEKSARPLTWWEQDAISPYFWKADVIERPRLIYRVNGEVDPFCQWV
ncbi:hypothetical protein F5Y13DRAFT_101368 [Hypoxylon sp. FL1857]|nr:hypothetical protein F5Y13DRAFT_101368 [Hypoxylon sp. FL1857]